jgi:ABC-2 type transport system ATP-binding protein
MNVAAMERLAVPHSPAAAVDQAALSFRDVTKRYAQGALALDNVSWTVSTGSRTCLLGPNGAGKSTCIRLLEGALRPTSGQVSLLGVAVDGPGYLDARRRTGIVPQGPGMYTDLTCGEYLDVARRLYGRGELSRVVEVFDLGEHLSKPLAALSGGYQRRAVLAAASLGEPDLLLLDEPTVGLDPVAQHDVHAFLREAMARESRTTLLCTHNLAEAQALCEDVIILRSGRVVVHAPLEQLRARTQPQLRLAARQDPRELSLAIAKRGLVPKIQDDGSVVVHTQNPQALAPDLLRGLLADGLDVYACEPVEASLEDVFLDLVKDQRDGAGQ